MPAPTSHQSQSQSQSQSHRKPSYRGNDVQDTQDNPDNISYVEFDQEAENIVTEFHRVLTREPLHQYSEAHQAFDRFLQKENKAGVNAGVGQPRLGVCFQDVSTWAGAGTSRMAVKTLKDALWRTLTGQDLYEWTIGRLRSRQSPDTGRPLIRNFSGVVRGGEIML